MTRWKREETQTLILMHRHNVWSNWYSLMLEAAERLNIPVGKRLFANCSGDGSTDCEYYVPASADLNAVRDLATRLEDN